MGQEGNTRIIVQCESEKRMHRILYFVRFLRALIFQSFFLFIAAKLYVLFGVTGLYPGATQLVDNLRIQSQRSEAVCSSVQFCIIVGPWRFDNFFALCSIIFVDNEGLAQDFKDTVRTYSRRSVFLHL